MAIKLIYPVSGPITQLFGENPEFYKRWGYAGHNGIDWGIPTGTPIVAAADGTVDKVDFENGGYGNFVKMSHMDGDTKYYTYYAHLHSTSVKAGQKISAGTVVGLSNNTGASTGPHLHFGIKIDGQNPAYKGYLDPMPYLTGTATPTSPTTPGTDSTPDAPVVPGAIVGAIDLPNVELEVTYDGVNVRSGPGVEYTILEQLEVGTKIQGTRMHSWSAWAEFEPGQWCAMTFNLVDYMKVIGSGALNTQPITRTNGAIQLPSLNMEVANDFLRVRSGPDTTYPQVALLNRGDQVTGRQMFATRAWIEFGQDKWVALTFEGTQYLIFS
ncbi:MAG TPA: peptidoglycan DD-metalloendopeptidase family protein [Anaerolineales bacterium]|nr:peptidoglycan DD-metalloendopeptidase family protein [Anaerolineales bacterium]